MNCLQGYGMQKLKNIEIIALPPLNNINLYEKKWNSTDLFIIALLEKYRNREKTFVQQNLAFRF